MTLTPLTLLAAALLAFAAPASADAKTFVATLSGAAEAVPNASPATGFATITVDDVAKTMRVQASFADPVAPDTAAHIHCCVSAPGAAGVATVTPTFTGFPGGAVSCIYDRLFDMTLASSWNGAFIAAHGGTTASAFIDLLAGLEGGRAYFNVHSSTFPGGEIRGFLAAPVPEPSSYALMLAGLARVVGAARRVRRR